jgi:predicted MFS family arabinose efflux permease
MMVPVGRLAVLRTTEKRDLMRAIAVLTWPGLTAPLIGPPLGGFIAEHLSWRWIFFLNVPLGLAGIALALRLVPHMRGAARPPFDWLGFALGAGLCLCATAAFDLLGRVDVPWRRPALLAAVAAALGFWLLRHLRRHPHPILDASTLQVSTFRATVLGGTRMRVLISAMPFLLPLLFQLGFGLDPFRSGLLVLALFAGNVAMKPLTSPVLRRWGFRGVLVVNGLVQAATMLGCAALTPGTPVPVIVALLVVSGASRFLQFTALSTLAFADVPEPSMTAANTLFSMAFQFALGLGVALGAVALRLAGLVTGTEGDIPSLADFQVAFATIALLTAAAALDGLKLDPDAGAVVARRFGAGR